VSSDSENDSVDDQINDPIPPNKRRKTTSTSKAPSETQVKPRKTANGTRPQPKASKPPVPKLEPNLTTAPLTCSNAMPTNNPQQPTPPARGALPPNTPPPRHAIGTTGFTKPFSGLTAAMNAKKVLVTVAANQFDSVKKAWQCQVCVDDPHGFLPAGTNWWTPERNVDAGVDEDENVLVRVGGEWICGIVTLREREDGEFFFFLLSFFFLLCLGFLWRGFGVGDGSS
jgi:hypothetical protein